MSWLVVVGDVHGCLVELFQLLDAVKFDYSKDNLILVGDMCNKGPCSQEVRAAQVPASAEGACGTAVALPAYMQFQHTLLLQWSTLYAAPAIATRCFLLLLLSAGPARLLQQDACCQKAGPGLCEATMMI
jgi:hypothetical protein